MTNQIDTCFMTTSEIDPTRLNIEFMKVETSDHKGDNQRFTTIGELIETLDLGGWETMFMVQGLFNSGSHVLRSSTLNPTFVVIPAKE